MNKNQTLVLLPGVLNTSSLWHNQIADLGSSFRIITPETHHNPSLRGTAETILKTLEQESIDKFALGGMSMGGYLAIEIMKLAKERVSHLALLHTSLRSDTPLQVSLRRRFIKQSYSGKFNGVTPRLLPSLLGSISINDHNVRDLVLGMASEFSGADFRMQQEAILSRKDTREFAKTIDCPTVVVGGEEDAVTPLFLQEEIHQLIAGSEFHVLEGCGHLSPIEKPSEVSRIFKEWLEK